MSKVKYEKEYNTIKNINKFEASDFLFEYNKKINVQLF